MYGLTSVLGWNVINRTILCLFTVNYVFWYWSCVLNRSPSGPVRYWVPWTDHHQGQWDTEYHEQITIRATEILSTMNRSPSGPVWYWVPWTNHWEDYLLQDGQCPVFLTWSTFLLCWSSIINIANLGGKCFFLPLLLMREVLFWNLSSDTGFSDWEFSCFFRRHFSLSSRQYLK
jgi:hypothetical protein